MAGWPKREEERRVLGFETLSLKGLAFNSAQSFSGFHFQICFYERKIKKENIKARDKDLNVTVLNFLS